MQYDRRLLSSIAKVIFCTFAAISLQKFCHSQTDGFSLHKIKSELSYNKNWDPEIPYKEEEIEQVRSILKQPFRYIGKGAQCYVFASEDDEYVVKFFRLYHLRPPLWMSWIPFPFGLQKIKQNKIETKQKELDKDFTSYKIAYNELKQETGLVYIHLNKTENLHVKTDLYDKIGIHYKIDMDQMEFALQKKADLFFPALKTVLDDPSKARLLLHDLVHLLFLRFEKGIFDKDPDINTNFGVLQGHPIQIDIGRFRPDPFPRNDSEKREAIIRITDNLRQWLVSFDPNLAEYLQNEIASLGKGEEQ